MSDEVKSEELLDENVFDKVREAEGEEPMDELDLAAQQMRDNMWVDSILLNYTEELDVHVPDPASPGQDKRVLRRVSMGITVKSDNRAPIKVLHRAASKSLNHIFEEEKEHWLDEEKMKAEIARVQRSLRSKEVTDDKGTTGEEEKPAS